MLLHRTAHEGNRGRRGDVGPVGQRLTDPGVGRLVEHEPDGTIVGVLDHEHHRTEEVGVVERRHRHEQAAGSRRHRATVAQTPRRTGTTPAEASLERERDAGTVCILLDRHLAGVIGLPCGGDPGLAEEGIRGDEVRIDRGSE